MAINKEIYKEAWDRNKKVFDKFKEISKVMNDCDIPSLEISLTYTDVVEIVTTFAHCRTLESKKEEFSEYWEGEKIEPFEEET